ncbi:MAG: PTS sugar transporter subunit IIA [Chitinispirillaceae bacterium]|nr:PTS sugar transporter subunit IIA [Chitinispirillaceae bacterium]
MKIRDLLNKSSILIDLQGTNKTEIINQMTHYMASIENLSDPDLITRKILEREADMSTGIGFGIAIPHARIEKIGRVHMVVAKSVAGVDFSAIDEQPVHLIFLMISPANTSTEHTQTLSSLSRIMSYEDMRKKLFAATTAEQFLDLLVNGEDRYVE